MPIDLQQATAFCLPTATFSQSSNTHSYSVVPRVSDRRNPAKQRARSLYTLSNLQARESPLGLPGRWYAHAPLQTASAAAQSATRPLPCQFFPSGFQRSSFASRHKRFHEAHGKQFAPALPQKGRSSLRQSSGCLASGPLAQIPTLSVTHTACPGWVSVQANRAHSMGWHGSISAQADTTEPLYGKAAPLCSQRAS